MKTTTSGKISRFDLVEGGGGGRLVGGGRVINVLYIFPLVIIRQKHFFVFQYVFFIFLACNLFSPVCGDRVTPSNFFSLSPQYQILCYLKIKLILKHKNVKPSILQLMEEWVQRPVDVKND